MSLHPPHGHCRKILQRNPGFGELHGHRKLLLPLPLPPYLTLQDGLSAFNIGTSTLLLFHLGTTSADKTFTGAPGKGEIAGHGPDQSIVTALGLQNGTNTPSNLPNHPELSLKLHYAFAVEKREDVLAWEKYFQEKGVHIHSTMEWDRGGRSVYFYDPDGHVGEIVSRGIWPHW
jgi:catechol 2,3-dioxygenase-like lactoylglutathione lyase family enzyme